MTPHDLTSPTMPTPSPRSPLTPGNMQMDIDMSADVEMKMDLDKPLASPLPQLVTSFSSEQMLQYHRQASFSAMVTTPRSTVNPAPWRRSNGSTCRRNSLTSPMTSPTQAAFTPMSPAFSSYTTLSPSRTFFHYTPTTPNRAQDGRQSRMAMRSPGYGVTMTLPLRVNTSLSNVQEEESQYSTDTPSSSSSTSSLIEWAPAFATTSNTTASTSSPTNTSRRLMRSHTPAPITTRSPIRKRPKLSRFPSSIRLPPPPKYHVTVVPTVSPRTERAKQQYKHSVEHLRAPLVPLISVSSGMHHTQFPTSLLQYHLLTHDQLDSLARWYHQVTPPVEETFQYPAWIPAWTGLHSPRRLSATIDNISATDLETKRRRWGRFIGLRGCESPTVETDLSASGEEVDGEERVVERPDELARRMEREWRRALQRAEEEAQAFEKSWRGRW